MSPCGASPSFFPRRSRAASEPPRPPSRRRPAEAPAAFDGASNGLVERTRWRRPRTGGRWWICGRCKGAQPHGLAFVPEGVILPTRCDAQGQERVSWSFSLVSCDRPARRRTNRRTVGGSSRHPVVDGPPRGRRRGRTRRCSLDPDGRGERGFQMLRAERGGDELRPYADYNVDAYYLKRGRTTGRSDFSRVMWRERQPCRTAGAITGGQRTGGGSGDWRSVGGSLFARARRAPHCGRRRGLGAQRLRLLPPS